MCLALATRVCYPALQPGWPYLTFACLHMCTGARLARRADEAQEDNGGGGGAAPPPGAVHRDNAVHRVVHAEWRAEWSAKLLEVLRDTPL